MTIIVDMRRRWFALEDESPKTPGWTPVGSRWASVPAMTAWLAAAGRRLVMAGLALAVLSACQQ
ncbi:MAG: hypothetical protein WBD79_16450, partial [Anaerolineae bacterium]